VSKNDNCNCAGTTKVAVRSKVVKTVVYQNR